MKISLKELEAIALSPYCLKLPGYVEATYMKCLLNGINEADVPDSFNDDVASAASEYESEKKEQIERDAEYKKVGELRCSGMAKEEVADNAGAISDYAVAIILGEQSKFNLFTAYAYAYERIIVCLRKAKDLEREVKYIEDYLRHDLSDTTRQKYSTRLEKLKTKINNK